MPGQADPAHRRLALLIATSDYTDPALRQLRAPGRDASDLAEVLGNPQIGGFAVQTLINARCGELLEAIEEFFDDRSPDDQLLIYLSCHGVLDDRGRLWYAATDTRRLRTAATAVGSAWLNDRLEDCRARSQIVILDCCHSGAFASGAKGGAELALEQRFRPTGRGRVVLTASRGTEYSFEGDQASGEGVRSVFTQAIVDGLRNGDADLNKDGLITVTDIYHHVYERVRAAEQRQTPELWTYGAEGDVLLAYSVRGAVIEPAALPEDLRVTLESPRPRIRETAVAELAELADGARPGLALSARQALQQISDEDIPRVAAIARVALEAPQGTAAREVSRELADREQRERARQEAERAAAEEAEEPLTTDLERVPGPDHLNILTSRNDLANAYQEAGRAAEAIPLFEQTLADSERVLGSDHPDTLNSRNNLAIAYQAAGPSAD
jgi:tetratricopeptide (TPR) repeat protein